jgi:uncharacterized protein
MARTRTTEDDPTMTPPASGGASSAGAIAKVGLIVYVLAALLNSSTLLAAARDMRAGSMARSIALPLARANNAVARAFHLTTLGERADKWRGRSGGGETGFAFSTTTTPVTSVPEPVPTVATGLEPVPNSTTSTAAKVPTTTTTVFAQPTGRRPATTSDRMRIYVAGDSLVQGWGEALQRRLAAATVVDLPTVDYRPATGLMRPDKFDWPRRLESQVSARHPDVVIVGFGGNDGQRIELDRQIYDVAAPEWQAEYRRRVASTLDFLLQEQRTVIWVGTPTAQNRTDNDNQRIINEIYRDEIAKRPAAKFVDTWTIFGGPDGVYAAYIDINGTVKLVRGGDGFHLNVTGADRLAADIYDAVLAEVASRNT